MASGNPCRRARDAFIMGGLASVITFDSDENLRRGLTVRCRRRAAPSTLLRPLRLSCRPRPKGIDIAPPVAGN